MAFKLLLIKISGMLMKTTNHHGRKVVGLNGIGPNGSNGKHGGAGRGRSHDELEQRVAELERQVAGLAANNAKLVRVNEGLAGAQTLLQAMLDNSPDWIYFKDTQSRILKIGRTLAKDMGMADPEEAVGKTDFDFQASGTGQGVLCG